jgi:hypothetical protein
MLQLAARPGCTVVAGVSGSGKTTFALRYLVARSDFTCRFLFQEPKRDFTERLKLPDAETQGELDLAVEDGFVIFHPAQMFPGNWPGALDWFSKWSYDVAMTLPGRKVLMVDEMWRYCSPYSVPAGVNQWVYDGRSFGCETIFNTTAPNKLNETLLGGATELVSFRQQKGRKGSACLAELGMDRGEIENLPPGAFVALNCETGGELRGRMW